MPKPAKEMGRFFLGTSPNVNHGEFLVAKTGCIREDSTIGVSDRTILFKGATSLANRLFGIGIIRRELFAGRDVCMVTRPKVKVKFPKGF